MPFEYSQFFQEYFDSVMLPYTLLSNSIGFLLGIAMYVLRSLGMYTIAKRRGINKPWLAWIPVVNCWIVGCISDQYQYVVKGKTKNKRKWLLGLNIVMYVGYVVGFVFLGVLVARAIGGAFTGMSEVQLIEAIMGQVAGMLLGLLFLLGIAIAVMVISYMSMYDLYTSCTPGNNVLFLVLSIFFSVTEPFFVFFIRNKDDGMPPRRETQPQVCIPSEPPKEPWETNE